MEEQISSPSSEANPGRSSSNEMNASSVDTVQPDTLTEAVYEQETATEDEAPVTTTRVADAGESVEEEEIGEKLPEDPWPVQRGSRWPTRAQLTAWAPFWAVMLLGGILRFWNLGARPLHFDESEHAYFSLGLLHNLQHWAWCYGLDNAPAGYTCYQYNPLLHGPFQFHAIALVYQLSQWLGAPDNGINSTTVRIAAALLGTVIIILPYFLRDFLGKFTAWVASLLLAISPSMVYFSRFAREDIYMACFTLLLVVATARYIRERKMRWIVLAAAGFSLSYATNEATFLTIAVFGSFLIGLILWEAGSLFPLRATFAQRPAARFLPRTFAPVAVLVVAIVGAIAAKIFFGILGHLSTYINSHTNASNTGAADIDLAHLESLTVSIIPWLGILLGFYVLSILLREIYGKLPAPDRRGLARFVDQRQSILDTILTMPWTHWFFALIVGWAIFLLLFTVVFTNIAGGIGDGIWRGLYYWLQQQNVARGGQPWYYYLLLIPLYEQIGVVFGIVGIIRCLCRPNRFRLFLVYWFIGNFGIYSWAGEKMPWLMINMTLPLMLLAAIGLEPGLLICYHFVKERFFSRSTQPQVAATDDVATLSAKNPWARPHSKAVIGFSIFGVIMAILSLLPTLQNMYQVNYVHDADGPYEMMIYVQTPNDINTVMSHIAAVDQKESAGKHEIDIGVTADAEWPFAWYLRDYPNVCYDFPTACPSWKNTAAVIISGGDDPAGDIAAYAPTHGNYLYHVYNLRTWWDEGYKMPPCPTGQPSSATCADPEDGTGVGPGLWLSYGDDPPANAQFNLGLTIERIWNWWWYRQPFGATTGAYNMELFIQKSAGVNP